MILRRRSTVGRSRRAGSSRTVTLPSADRPLARPPPPRRHVEPGDHTPPVERQVVPSPGLHVVGLLVAEIVHAEDLTEEVARPDERRSGRSGRGTIMA